MGSNNGVSDEKLLAIHDYATDDAFSSDERLVLEYADGITLSSEDVSSELFARLAARFSPEEILELTFTVAYENFLSKFHRALRVESQGFCVIPAARLTRSTAEAAS